MQSILNQWRSYQTPEKCDGEKEKIQFQEGRFAISYISWDFL